MEDSRGWGRRERQDGRGAAAPRRRALGPDATLAAHSAVSRVERRKGRDTGREEWGSRAWWRQSGWCKATGGGPKLATSLAPRKTPRAAPPPSTGSFGVTKVATARGRAVGWGVWGRCPAELHFLTFAAAKLLPGSSAGVGAPQELPRQRVGEEHREHPRQVPLARVGC